MVRCSQKVDRVFVGEDIGPEETIEASNPFPCLATVLGAEDVGDRAHVFRRARAELIALRQIDLVAQDSDTGRSDVDFRRCGRIGDDCTGNAGEVGLGAVGP